MLSWTLDKASQAVAKQSDVIVNIGNSSSPPPEMAKCAYSKNHKRQIATGYSFLVYVTFKDCSLGTKSRTSASLLVLTKLMLICVAFCNT